MDWTTWRMLEDIKVNQHYRNREAELMNDPKEILRRFLDGYPYFSFNYPAMTERKLVLPFVLPIGGGYV
jgi:cephalosporin hydroxylase